MTKHEFLSSLRGRMKALPAEDLEKTLQYYSEMIDDITEGGTSEEDAVASLGSLDEIVGAVMADRAETAQTEIAAPMRRRLSWWAILLIILGSPIWLSLLVAVVAVIFAIAVSVLSVVVSFFAVAVSLVAVGIAAFGAMIVPFISGKIAVGAVYLGMGFGGIGFGILIFIGTAALTNITVKGIKKLFHYIQSRPKRGGHIV